jgi:hypothetical protein
MGMANTNQIYARLTTAGGVATSSYAAGVAWAYTNNSKTDWFLPSKAELYELYTNRASVGGFEEWYYLSSSENYLSGNGTYYITVWGQFFASGQELDNGLSKGGGPHELRPVRAF